MSSQPRPPPQRGMTVRAALEAALAEAPESGLTARELSAHVGIAEKEVAAHLEHLERSLKAAGARLEVLAAECLACGYTFCERRRLTRPGACPECRATRIAPPAFRVVR